MKLSFSTMAIVAFFSVLPGASFADLYYQHVASVGEWETEIGIVNTNTEQSLSGTLRLFGDDGNPVSTPLQATLAPGGRENFVVGESFAESDDIGYIVFETDSTCAVGYEKFYIRGLYRAAVPAESTAGNANVTIPHIASDESFSTGISLLNTTSSKKSLRIVFDDGESKEVVLGPKGHASFSVRSLFDNSPRPDVRSAVIENSEGVMGLSVFGGIATGDKESLSGVLLQRNGAVNLIYPHVVSGPVYWTGIAALNVSEETANLSVIGYRSDGSIAGTVAKSLPAGERLAETVQSLGFPLDCAWVRIVADRPVMGFELFRDRDMQKMGGHNVVGTNSTDGLFAGVDMQGDSEIALVNGSDASASIRLTAVADDGLIVGEEIIAIGPHEKKMERPENFFNTDISGASYIRYKSNRNIVAVKIDTDGMLMDALQGLRQTCAPADNGEKFRVLAFNDLGMHCMDKEYSVFSILPPFNVVNAQVISNETDGSPVLLDESRVEIRYDAVADRKGSVNSTSVGKTRFWSYAEALFGVSLKIGEGLTGFFMPMDNPGDFGAQSMHYNATREWFSAEGIPITPLGDSLENNTYPMLRVSAYDKAKGELLAEIDAVVPVATETDCSNCHATGSIAASEPEVSWSQNNDEEIQSKTNILILHDLENGTGLLNSQPVLCSSCHYSPPLDLAGNGPQGEQANLPTFSATMHEFHGRLEYPDGTPVFDPETSVDKNCYQCHPGKITLCQRGAMKAGGMECTECHGDMLAVGGAFSLMDGGSLDGTNDGGNRRPWMDLPRCQSCHTGDAVSRLTGAGLVLDSSGIRLRQAYRTGDPAASPILADNKRFAENTGTLFRNSKGHGGAACEGCHGSTHAVWPNPDAEANDNLAAVQIQGHDGTIIECIACHGQNGPPLGLDGPHGMHTVGDGRWNREHEEFYEDSSADCLACHGLDLAGTPLATVAADRNLIDEEGASIALLAGRIVRCDICHEMPGNEDIEED